jgi:ATP-dependent Lon protease
LYKDEKNKGLKLNGISLEHFSFFSTVNYINNLVPLLKNEIEVREMGGLTDTEKEEILKIKRAEINSRFGFDNEEEIITNRFLKTLIQYVKESGIRRKEKVLRRIEKDYIVNEKVDKELVENPMFWLRENVAIYKEDFSFKKKHFLLIFVLLLN